MTSRKMTDFVKCVYFFSSHLWFDFVIRFYYKFVPAIFISEISKVIKWPRRGYLVYPNMLRIHQSQLHGDSRKNTDFYFITTTK